MCTRVHAITKKRSSLPHGWLKSAHFFSAHLFTQIASHKQPWRPHGQPAQRRALACSSRSQAVARHEVAIRHALRKLQSSSDFKVKGARNMHQSPRWVARINGYLVAIVIPLRVLPALYEDAVLFLNTTSTKSLLILLLQPRLRVPPALFRGAR
jgi:hypothetical protein